MLYAVPIPDALFRDADFVKLRTAEYVLGSLTNLENPRRTVKLAGFEIGKYEVTNAQFSRFVAATKYVTDAETSHNAMVFHPPLEEFRWKQDKTATWRFPNGKSKGGIRDKMNHPVTTISFRDALAFCKWAKVRLPTLDEWEAASRGGAETLYFCGDDYRQVGKYANIWHRPNHLANDKSDGYVTTSPVGSFAPNPLGLYDIYGNVFEFCSGSLKRDTKEMRHARGGSWWCSAHACGFFNSDDIGTVNEKASFSNQGFRVAR